MARRRLGRRRFLGHALVGGAGAIRSAHAASASPPGAEEAPSPRIAVGVMGLSRGRGLALQFAAQPGVEVAWVCDVDTERTGQAVRELVAAGAREPRVTGDFRRILDDDAVDVLVCAAPNHWHATATVRGLEAGKHVYVEKPCCHTPAEGEVMIAAARKHGRCVQVGTQRRSGAGIIEAIGLLHAGAIGRVYAARACYASARPSIGRGKPAAVPGNIDWELWQGPAPRREWIDNRVHYNWHWFWHWGNGEFGNNGVHTIDLCRWGLGVDFPENVTSSGGRFAFEDDQETPDTQAVSFRFPDRKLITWEGRSCNRQGEDDFVTFHGETGSLKITDGGSFTLLDAKNAVVESKEGTRGDVEHLVDFLGCIRADTPPALHAGIETAWPSTLLCLLGNIAQRSGRTLACDPTNGHILGDAEAAALWERTYERGWELRS